MDAPAASIDYYAAALAYACVHVRDPRLLDRLDQIVTHLRARGVAADDEAVPRYAEAVLCWRPEERALFRAHVPVAKSLVEPQSAKPTPAVVRLAITRARAGRLVVPVVVAAELAAAVLTPLILWYRDRPDPAPTPDAPSLTPGGVSPASARGDPPPVLAEILTYMPNVLFVFLLLGIAATYGLFLYRRSQKRIAFQKGGNPDTRPLAALSVVKAHRQLFGGPQMRDALRNLRRHRPVPSTVLDVRPTLRATIASGGFPVMRYASRPVSPEYLILSEREMAHDHLPEVGLALATQLDMGGAIVRHYEFFGTPERLRCVSARREASTVEPLDAVLASHPGARILLVMESFDVRTRRGLAPRWLAALQEFGTPVLFNPRDTVHWDGGEVRLADLGLPSVPADPRGLADYARALVMRNGTGGAVSVDGGSVADLPALLVEHRDRLMDEQAPDPDFVAAILANLHIWLGPEGMQWLRALALFPILSSGYTFFAGSMMTECLSHSRYLRLCRLPWLRTGEMPDWLRAALVAQMSDAEARHARAVAQAYLLTREGDDVERAALLERGGDSGARRRLRRQLAQSDNPLLRDRFLLNALDNRPATELGLEVLEPMHLWRERIGARLTAMHAERIVIVVIMLVGLVTFQSENVRRIFFQMQAATDASYGNRSNASVPDLAQTNMAAAGRPSNASAAADQGTNGANAMDAPALENAAGNASGRAEIPPVTTPNGGKTPQRTQPQILVFDGKSAQQDKERTHLPRTPNPRLYVHIADTGQREMALAFIRAMNGQTLDGLPIIMSGVLPGAQSLTRAQLRCFGEAECAWVGVLLEQVRRAGVGAVDAVSYVGTAYEGGGRPNHFEIWLGTSAFTETGGSAAKVATTSKTSEMAKNGINPAVQTSQTAPSRDGEEIGPFYCGGSNETLENTDLKTIAAKAQQIAQLQRSGAYRNINVLIGSPYGYDAKILARCAAPVETVIRNALPKVSVDTVPISDMQYNQVQITVEFSYENAAR